MLKNHLATADCVVVGGKELHVIDLKYGQGVLVDARENTQLNVIWTRCSNSL